ncbi:hypothetical protein CCP3SC5AM1_20043 [Gammaproteobacteria bacterium]
MRSLRTIWFPVLIGIVFLTEGCAATIGQENGRFSTEHIEQLVAPIALYPDALLAQVLIAATYPLEVIQVARWARQHPDLSEKKRQAALAEEPWDPSVKSLTAFPGVLERMEAELTWMENLGNAFLGQQDEVMDAVQRLRTRAQAAGYLENTPQQKIVTRDRVIFIEPAQPEVIYVPTYNPTLVFGDWRYQTIYYPNFQIAAYPQSRNNSNAGLITFGVGMLVGGILFSQFDWHHRYVTVNHQRHYFDHRDQYYFPHNESNAPIQWQHDPFHRHNVRYHTPILERYYSQEHNQPDFSSAGFKERYTRRHPAVPNLNREERNNHGRRSLLQHFDHPATENSSSITTVDIKPDRDGRSIFRRKISRPVRDSGSIQENNAILPERLESRRFGRPMIGNSSNPGRNNENFLRYQPATSGFNIPESRHSTTEKVKPRPSLESSRSFSRSRFGRKNHDAGNFSIGE